MSEFNIHKEMILHVANALGDELLKEVVFVGGCTTGLLITDEFTRDQVRHTEDVDLIVHVLSYSEWSKLQKMLRERGFKDHPIEDAPICSMKYGELRVDFMPDKKEILNFTNKWYEDALRSADNYILNSGITIKLVKPIYFIATKLEAYISRGNNDPLESRDIEDLLNLFAGREELLSELENAPNLVKVYISEQLRVLFNNNNFNYAIQSAARGDHERETYLIEKLKMAIGCIV